MTILHTLALGVLAVVIGLAVGILGGGGAILAVPVFTFIAGFPASQAVGASFVVVGASSLFGVLSTESVFCRLLRIGNRSRSDGFRTTPSKTEIDTEHRVHGV